MSQWRGNLICKAPPLLKILPRTLNRTFLGIWVVCFTPTSHGASFLEEPHSQFSPMFVVPCPHRERDYSNGSNFWKLYLIRTGFTSGELVSLIKVLGCLDWNGLFWCSGCGHSRKMYDIVSIGRGSVFMMACLI
jgi:hypothetical protein